MLAGPAMIGVLADVATLPVALAVVAVLLGSVVVAAGQLLPPEATERSSRAASQVHRMPQHSSG